MFVILIMILRDIFVICYCFVIVVFVTEDLNL